MISSRRAVRHRRERPYIAATIVAILTVGLIGAAAAGDPLQETFLKARDASESAGFGEQVELDGRTLVVTAPFDVSAEEGPGAAYVFAEQGGTWTERQKLVPEGATDRAEFGRGVSIHGDWIAVGAPRDLSGGAVFLFRREAIGWVQRQRLSAEGAAEFGSGVAVQSDLLVVGARSTRLNGVDRAGRAFVYRHDGTAWNLEQALGLDPPIPFAFFGRGIRIENGAIFIGAQGEAASTGAVYVFEKENGNWIQKQRLVPSEPVRRGFGGALDVHDDVLVSTAQTRDPGNGAGFVFRRNDQGWMEEQRLTHSEATRGFGSGCSVHGDTVLIGAAGDEQFGERAGAAFFFEYDGMSWEEKLKLTSSNAMPFETFGSGVALDGGVAAVGAVTNSDTVPQSGATYVYEVANEPPTADAGDDADSECASRDGTVVTLDGSASTDPDSTQGTNDDIVRFEWFEDFELPTESFVGEGEILDVTLPLGSHVITLRVIDTAGASSTDDVVKRVLDTTAPEISVGVEPDVLWPPNRRMVEITARPEANDLCGDVLVTLSSITFDDAGDLAPRQPDTRSADTGTADLSYELRAERHGAGQGRVYVITYVADDVSGNTSAAEAHVTVPHDRR